MNSECDRASLRRKLHTLQLHFTGSPRCFLKKAAAISTVSPHHGSLIELGRGDYHAELVHDSATHTMTIYLLDSAAKNAVTIPAQQLSLNLLVAGKPQQYQLMAQPQPTDPEGMCSAFTSASETMCKAMDAKGTTGRLNVPIEGKVFAGRIDTHTHAHPH
jgi:hypothetical protein